LLQVQGGIAGHLVKDIIKKGNHVRAIDIKPLSQWYQVSDEADNLVSDLRLMEKEPAAIYRKVVEASINGKKEIVIWGDGYKGMKKTYDWLKEQMLRDSENIPGISRFNT
jgi:hypothetical protein